MLKTPKFWTKKSALAYALLPLSLLYLCGFYVVKFFTKTTKISKPVICVGNVIAGGAGKTPVCIALGKILHEMSVSFAYLSRGYMSDGSKFLLLRKDDNNKAEQVGDEPMMLIETAPTFVSTNRIFGARQLENMKKFDAVVLDDGMQNNSLHRDFTIMVVDGKIAFGNNFLLPAGPMREPLCAALKKTNLVVVVGDASPLLQKKLAGKKIVKAEIIATNLDRFHGKKLIAFCGLAYPEKFFSFLREKGLEVLETHSFPDHYHYQVPDLENLFQIAKEKDATLITTQKDWVKFTKFFREKICHLNIRLEFENKELVKEELKKIIIKK
jgi:tetraacyldisaccharide 4'-kinase